MKLKEKKFNGTIKLQKTIMRKTSFSSKKGTKLSVQNPFFIQIKISYEAHI